MNASSCWAFLLVIVSGFVPALGSSPSASETPARRGGVTLPLSKQHSGLFARRYDEDDVLGGTIGLGDSADFFYSVAVIVGDSTITLNLDTGSSDLWATSNDCQTPQCQQSGAERYDTKTFKPTGNTVNLRFGDSVTGTHAAGPVGRDIVTLAGLTMTDQPVAAINDTDNSAVSNGGSGILGLGFFGQSFVQAAAINAEFPSASGTDTFINETVHSGPIVSRLLLNDQIEEPLFAITLQRDKIDVSGNGQLTIGQLPAGVNNASITWVPVRLYRPEDGGLNPPSFAPNELYPLRWEIEFDAVFIDGKRLPDSTQQATGIKTPTLSALIDTGNSLLRGPADVVSNILNTVSPAFAADPTSQPFLPCNEGHNLTFQIGGRLFPVDPRDLISQAQKGDAEDCVAGNIVATDPPALGALFSWNLGDPFLKSNMVVFYYGNLTHPSADPPRIDLLSLVPENAEMLLDDAVDDAENDGGAFESEFVAHGLHTIQ
ncbi:acid protease [Trametes maxima]|nr:acid protease [Trametes maxima]